MTITKAIEGAIYDLIRAQELGVTPPLIRCWHGLREDHTWDWYEDRELPCIDIRCSPPVYDDNRRTLSARCQINVITNGADDRDHAQIDMIEEGIQTALDTIYKELYNGATGSTFTAFENAIKTDFALVESVGGIDIEQGDEPADEAGNPTVGFSVTIHYSRTDY